MDKLYRHAKKMESSDAGLKSLTLVILAGLAAGWV
jgi:hypothetical protein